MQLPITQAVQDQVANIARSEGMPRGLKIESKTNILLYDSALIAGVDYPHDLQEDEEKEVTNITDEMHPDEIAGLAQEIKVNHDQDEIEAIDDEIPYEDPREQQLPIGNEQESEIEIVFEDKES